MRQDENDILPYDDSVTDKSIISKSILTLGCFLKSPIRSLALIRNAQNGEDSIYFVLLSAWPIVIISETFKYICFRNEYLKSIFFPHSRTPDMSIGWTIVYMIFSPIGIAISLWIYSAVNHAMLWCWRGLTVNAGMRQSSRATGFVVGFTTVLLIPFQVFSALTPMLRIHAYIGLITAFICAFYMAFGLAVTHRSKFWQGLGAVFTPPIILSSIIWVISKQSPLDLILH